MGSEVLLRQLVSWTAVGTGDAHSSEFVLRYEELADWAKAIETFANKHEFTLDQAASLLEHLSPLLAARAITVAHLSPAAVYSIPAATAVRALLHSSLSEPVPAAVLLQALQQSHSREKRRLASAMPFYTLYQQPADPLLRDNTLLDDPEARVESILPRKLLPAPDRPTFIVYNNRGANTGGTAALESLVEVLEELGHSTLLCNDANSLQSSCREPHVDAVLVTGEWCRGALEDYDVESFPGRRVQFHLGFHHRADLCGGAVTVALSHFLHQSFAGRVLGALYLSCPMSRAVLAAHSELLQQEVQEGLGAAVRKEDLVVVDPDILRDYPLQRGLELRLPGSITVVYAEGIPREEFLTLLRRAKVVLDLALPGLERLAFEGVLLGAVPIVARAWGGSDARDFPGLRRVDPLNASDIAAAVVHAVENYEAELSAVHNAEFFRHSRALRRRFQSSVDLYFGSSRLLFLLAAQSATEESLALLQLLALYFLFPLASVDLAVRDVPLFWRQHYAVLSLLVEAGVLAEDPFHPATAGAVRGPSRGYMRVLALHEVYTAPSDSLEAVLLPPGLAVPSSDWLYSQLQRPAELRALRTVPAAALTAEDFLSPGQPGEDLLHVCSLLNEDSAAPAVLRSLRQSVPWLTATAVLRQLDALPCAAAAETAAEQHGREEGTESE